MRQAIYVITIDGTDVTSTFDPVLVSLDIKKDGDKRSDTVSITLDDTDGQILLPRSGAKVQVSLGWSDEGSVVTFEGTIDEIKSGGGRGHGNHHHHGGKHRHHRHDHGDYSYDDQPGYGAGNYHEHHHHHSHSSDPEPYDTSHGA